MSETDADLSGSEVQPLPQPGKRQLGPTDDRPTARLPHALASPLALTVTPAMRWLVARFAVPIGAPPRTACDNCHTPLSLAGLGRTMLGPPGRCGRCGIRVGAPPYLLEVLTAVAVCVVAVAATSIPVLLAGLWWTLLAIPLTFIDLEVHRLPDALTYPAAVGAVALLALNAGISDHWGTFSSAVVAGAASGLIFLALAVVLRDRGLGLGDVKLIVSITTLTAWWGVGMAFAALFLAFLASGIVGAVLLAAKRATRSTRIPMSPYFVGATLAVLALQATASA